MNLRYGGTVVHSSRDELGPIEVVEDRSQRSLHFGTLPKQSSMSLADPDALVLGYTRAMAGALLFNAAPRSALVIGLGGGSLAKFLLRHFPGCRVDAVELRPAVARLAHAYFGLPEADPRLAVHHGDAFGFVVGREGRFDYDLILIDAFDAHGMDQSVSEETFFAACYDRLSPSGVLAINLWHDQKGRVRQVLRTLGDAFDGHALRLPVPHKGNLIGLTTREPAPKRRLKGLDRVAAELEPALQVGLPTLLQGLRRANAFRLRR
ncbi:MAG TPA: fused MFS/spermidine synthase [Gammaproteobacteria bacterium]|nr:fused MFS/spermidine synthase [Gammaproteobacteria bacterium]